MFSLNVLLGSKAAERKERASSKQYVRSAKATVARRSLLVLFATILALASTILLTATSYGRKIDRTIAVRPFDLNIANALTPMNLQLKNSSPSSNKHNEMISMKSVAPIFLHNSHFESTLVLVNPGRNPGAVDIIVRSPEGDRVGHKIVSVAGLSQATIGFADLFQELRSTVPMGSLVVIPIGPSGNAIVGQLVVTGVTQRAPSNIDEELVMIEDKSSTAPSVMRAVASAANADTMLAITSLSSTMQHIRVTCFNEAGKPSIRTLELRPNATEVQSSCGGQDLTADLRRFETKPEHSIEEKATGIELTSDQMAGSFAAFLLAPHVQNDIWSFTGTAFSDAMMTESSQSVYAGVPMGPTASLDSETLTPKVSISNFGTKIAQVTVSVAISANDKSQFNTLATLSLPGGATRTVVLTEKGDPLMRNSLIVESNAASGDVISSVTLESTSQIVALSAKDGQDPRNGGEHPWSLKNGTHSILLLFNHTDDPASVTVNLPNSGSLWRKRYAVQAHETLAIDTQTLINDAIPDDYSHVIPPNVTEGMVNWIADAPLSITGRLEQSDSSEGIFRSFSCGGFYWICQYSLDPGYTGIFAGNSIEWDLNASECVSQDEDSVCTSNGQPNGQGNIDTTTWDWSSSLTYVAGGNGSFYLNMIAGDSGQVGADVQFQDDAGCPLHAFANADVWPKFTNISPPRGLVGTSVVVTISGVGLSTDLGADSSISISNVSGNSSQITATLNISPSAAGGNHFISDTSNAETSNVAFFVQIPSRETISNLPDAVTTTSNVYDYYGNLIATNHCGIYRNVQYNLVDQAGLNILGGDFSLTESFSNYSTTVSGQTVPPTQTRSPQNTAEQLLADTQAYVTLGSPCPSGNQHESFDQSIVIAIPPQSANTFPLTTVVHIDRGYYSGNGQVSITITTP